MKVKSSAAGLIIAVSLFALAGSIQASCFNNEPGWHMVSKKCDIRPADTWQEYKSGVYTQPEAKNLFSQ